MYEMKDEFDALLEVIESAEEEGLELDEIVVNHFNNLKHDLDTKIDNLAKFASNLKFLSENQKAEAAKITVLSKKNLNRYNSIKTFLKHFIKKEKNGSFQSFTHRLKVSGVGGKLPVLIADENIAGSFTDLDLVPTELSSFVIETTTFKLDKDALKDAIESGTVLTGVSLGERGEALRGI